MQNSGNVTKVNASFTAYDKPSILHYDYLVAHQIIIDNIKEICDTAILHSITTEVNGIVISNQVFNQNLDNK